MSKANTTRCKHCVKHLTAKKKVRYLAMAVSEDHEMIYFTLEVRKKVWKRWKWGIILFFVGVAGYLKLPL